jgi:Trk K+ transport system NAD-binding subunit
MKFKASAGDMRCKAVKQNRIGILLNMVKYGPYLLLRHIWIQLILLVAMFFLGALVFQHYQGLDWLTALLGSVSTITTIGIYAPNITSMPNSEKIWLVIIFIVSVGAAASLVQGVVTSVLKKELIVGEMDELKAKNSRDHVIIMGYSFLGKYVVGKLKELGLRSVVVARDEAQAQLARNGGDIALASPVSHSFDALKKAGIEHACAVVVTYDHDGDNMLAVMAAKKLNPAARVITIVNEKEMGEGVRSAQADVVITPSEIMGQVLAVSTVSSEIAGVFTTDKMKGKGIAEFEIKRDGIKLGDLEKICPVLLISRKTRLLSNAGQDFTLEKGDIVYALTDHEALVAFRTFVAGQKT